jgi:hypothetical protein
VQRAIAATMRRIATSRIASTIAPRRSPRLAIRLRSPSRSVQFGERPQRATLNEGLSDFRSSTRAASSNAARRRSRYSAS